MPCTLLFRDGSRANTSLTVDHDQFWLGRDPSCDVAFDPQNERMISARHAQIARVVVNGAAAYQLTDHSTNGTWVNGNRISAATTLHHGDIVQLSHDGPSFVFETPSSGTPSTASIGDLITTAPLTLTRLSDNRVKQFSETIVRIGRDPAAELSFDANQDLLVSFQHAKIVWIDAVAVLFDLDSTNGTLINHEFISRYELRGGETIEFGHGGPAFRCELGPRPSSSSASPRPTLIGQLGQVPNARASDGVFLRGVTLDSSKPLWRIGRSNDCDIRLDALPVSSHHAELTLSNGQLTLRDLNSANGIYIDGQRVVKSTTLQPHVEVCVGPFVLALDRRHPEIRFSVYDTRQSCWIAAQQISRIDAATGRRLLDNISLKIDPSQFVVILGPSGSGKSTLIKSLCGAVRAEQGHVIINHLDFYDHYAALKHRVGYVPQDDIIHPQLTVQRSLMYAARLRLPAHTTELARLQQVDSVLSMLELQDHRDKTINVLSGGQRKRVSIAVELLSEPEIIFMDEPTSGLDPHLEEKMMLLLRELSQRGKTVVAVTHTLDNIDLCDKVVFLAEGKLVFLGTPKEAKTYFRVNRFTDVYKRFEERRRGSDLLRKHYEQSPLFQQHVAVPLRAADASLSDTDRPQAVPSPRRVRQFFILSHRYAETFFRDWKTLLILLLQAPIIGLFIVLAAKTTQPTRGPTTTALLIMSLSALWFGCSNAARELTKEKSIFSRERMVNVGVIPYVASKFFVLQALSLIQVTLLLGTVYALRSGHVLTDVPAVCSQWHVETCKYLILAGVPGPFTEHLFNLYLTALNGIGLGLVVSAFASNSDKAISLVPLILIPQVLFSGAFGLPTHTELIKRNVGYAMALNWSLDQGKRIAMCRYDTHSRFLAECTSCLHTFDPNLIEQSNAQQWEHSMCPALRDISNQLTDFPETLKVVEDGWYTALTANASKEAGAAHHSYRGFVVLAGSAIILWLLATLIVKIRS